MLILCGLKAVLAGEIEIGSIDVRQHYVSGENQSSKRVELEKQNLKV